MQPNARSRRATWVVRIGAVVVVGAIAAGCTGDGRDVSSAAGPGQPSSPATTTAPTTVPSTAPATAPTTTTTTGPSTAPDESVVARHAGVAWFLGTMPDAPTRADDRLEPIRIGMINQEDTPVGSYPELRAAVEAGVEWVNTELGGVDGRPIELRTCITPFDPERSRACATELVAAGVVALAGGVDVTSDAAVGVLEQAGIPRFGGIPATVAEQRSPMSFFFSGGDSGALAAFMAHAAASGRTKVLLGYGQEVESFAVAARDYGAAVGRSLGLDVDVAGFSIFGTDDVELLATAQDTGADAVMMLAASTSCERVMGAAAELDLDAQLYLTGACASATALDAAGDDAVGVVFNAEGAVTGDDVDASIYLDVVETYAGEPAGGAGTVGFRGFMNLYSMLLDLGPDAATAEALTAIARSSAGRRSFWGHPFTCDGEQVPGLPALCAPQQRLFTLDQVGGPFREVTGWIPTDQLFQDALG
jgi:branched-chain amino acid transport system substrate-binding protein